MDKAKAQAVVDDLLLVCRKHGVWIAGSCESEGIWGEIQIGSDALPSGDNAEINLGEPNKARPMLSDEDSMCVGVIGD